MRLNTILIAGCMTQLLSKQIKQTRTNAGPYTGSLTQMECRPGPLFHGNHRETRLPRPP